MMIFHRWMFELNLWAPMWGITLIWALYAMYLGCFFGAATWVYSTLIRPIATQQKKGSSLYSAVAFSSVWIAFEALRSWGPFGDPAGFLGTATIDIPFISQIAVIATVFGCSFIVALLNSLLYFCATKKQVIYLYSSIGLCLSAIIVGYVSQELSTESKTTSPLSVVLIQPNHSQLDKLNPTKTTALLHDYLKSIKKALESAPHLIVLPETITPSLNLRKPWFTKRITDLLQEAPHTTLLFGTPTLEHHTYHNSAATYTQNGLQHIVHKTILMPFGEYWPLRPLLEKLIPQWLPANDYAPSPTKQSILESQLGKIGISICLESLYPYHGTNQAKENTIFQVALVNNAWFNDSPAAAQHLQMTRFRAIENNTYVLQAANTGISAIITPTGAIQKQLELNEKGLLTGSVIPRTTPAWNIYAQQLIRAVYLLICLPLLLVVRKRI